MFPGHLPVLSVSEANLADFTDQPTFPPPYKRTSSKTNSPVLLLSPASEGVSTACKHPWHVLPESLFLQDNWAANPTQPQLQVPSQPGSPPSHSLPFFQWIMASCLPKAIISSYTEMSSRFKQRIRNGRKALVAFSSNFSTHCVLSRGCKGYTIWNVI